MNDRIDKKDILKAEWANVIATVACFVATLSIVVSMFLSLSGKMDMFHTEIAQLYGRVAAVETRLDT